jgi:hypothetical protein
MKNLAILFLNVVLVLMIVHRVLDIDNDKGHLIFLFYYSALIVLNVTIGLLLKFMKSNTYRMFWKLSIWMACLFIPMYTVLVMI